MPNGEPKSVSSDRQNQLEHEIAKLVREFETETGFSVCGDIRVLRKGQNQYEPVFRVLTFITSIDKNESKIYAVRST